MQFIIDVFPDPDGPKKQLIPFTSFTSKLSLKLPNLVFINIKLFNIISFIF